MLNRNFSDPWITEALIASSFLFRTGSHSLLYLWCNDSIQMGKSDQVESELWILIRSSCSIEAASQSLWFKTRKHKFHIPKVGLNLEKVKKKMNIDLTLLYNLSPYFCCYCKKVIPIFSLLAGWVLLSFVALNILRKCSIYYVLYFKL